MKNDVFTLGFDDEGDFHVTVFLLIDAYGWAKTVCKQVEEWKC
jgi:hypothetical protein